MPKSETFLDWNDGRRRTFRQLNSFRISENAIGLFTFLSRNKHALGHTRAHIAHDTLPAN